MSPVRLVQVQNHIEPILTCPRHDQGPDAAVTASAGTRSTTPYHASTSEVFLTVRTTGETAGLSNNRKRDCQARITLGSLQGSGCCPDWHHT